MKSCAGPRWRASRASRRAGTAQELDQPLELRIAGRLGERRWNAMSSATPSPPSATARSMLASARRSAAICARVARSAARRRSRLERAAHLAHLDDGLHRIQHAGVESSARCGGGAAT
jgi:hypothetical protein